MFHLMMLCVIPLASVFAPVQEKAAAGDEVDVLITKAQAAYRGGKTQEAVDLLQKAIQKIQQSGEKGIVACLPPVAEGWKADPADSTSGSWGVGGEAMQWTQVERTYEREKDPVRVSVTITSSPQLMLGPKQMLQMLENPQYRAMLNQDPSQKIEVVKAEGFAGFKTLEKDSSAQVMLMGESFMVMVDVDRCDDALLDTFMKGLDLKTLSALDEKK